MSFVFDITVRFLDPYFHGRGEGESSEWPPSPLRLHQALLQALARTVDMSAGDDPLAWLQEQHPDKLEALLWLEQNGQPFIFAGAIEKTSGRTTYVPDNVGDKKRDVATRRKEKLVAPLRLHAFDGDLPSVTYRYEVPEDEANKLRPLLDIAANITHLGWGVDMVTASATLEPVESSTTPFGERWLPHGDTPDGSHRVPIQGTTEALLVRHQHYLKRMDGANFRPTPALACFASVDYRRATDPAPLVWAAFSLLKPDGSGFQAFSAPRKTREVAGLVRHAAATVAAVQGWPEERINTLLLGKSPDGAERSKVEENPHRFAYLPLPTINAGLDRVEAIRRVLVVAPPGCAAEIAWARRMLSGVDLIAPGGAEELVALLTTIPASDGVVRQYTGKARVWSTVTPVILPGLDAIRSPKHKGPPSPEATEAKNAAVLRQQAKTEGLIRKAFVQAGYHPDLVKTLGLEWSGAGFRNGVDLASRYLPPDNLNHWPRYHVRVTFPQEIRGPLVVGRGRFRGFGLFLVERS